MRRVLARAYRHRLFVGKDLDRSHSFNLLRYIVDQSVPGRDQSRSIHLNASGSAINLKRSMPDLRMEHQGSLHFGRQRRIVHLLPIFSTDRLIDIERGFGQHLGLNRERQTVSIQGEIKIGWVVEIDVE